MKNNILLILGLLFLTLNCNSQIKYNEKLKKQLKNILFTDQIYREFTDNNTTKERKEEIAKLTNTTVEILHKDIFKIIELTDKENLEKVKIIVNNYGYPGQSLVGVPENTAVFYVIQHNPDKISEYYPLIEEAGKNNELPFSLVAMMLDRKLTGEHKEQIYGTQLAMKQITNEKTGQKENFIYILPIIDAKNVNKRRMEAGFDTTVEDNAKRFGIEYKSYTYGEIDAIK